MNLHMQMLLLIVSIDVFSQLVIVTKNTQVLYSTIKKHLMHPKKRHIEFQLVR